MTAALHERLLAGLRGSVRDEVAAIADLEALIASWLADARRSWPTVAVADDVYVDYVAARVTEWEGAAALRSELWPTDLYLACACANGDERAVAAFEAAFRKDMDAVLIHSRASDQTREDVRQIALQKLFVAPPGKRSKIADYAGRGEMRKWLRMTVLRVFLDHQRKRKRANEVDVDDEILQAIPAHGADPQLAYLRTHYGAELNQSFKAAFRALSPRERTLLRQHHLHGVGLEQLAAFHRVHRVTLARWLGKARATLLGETRRALADKLAVPDSQLDSIIELVRSQLVISAERSGDAAPD